MYHPIYQPRSARVKRNEASGQLVERNFYVMNVFFTQQIAKKIVFFVFQETTKAVILALTLRRRRHRFHTLVVKFHVGPQVFLPAVFVCRTTEELMQTNYAFGADQCPKQRLRTVNTNSLSDYEVSRLRSLGSLVSKSFHLIDYNDYYIITLLQYSRTCTYYRPPRGKIDIPVFRYYLRSLMKTWKVRACMYVI